MQTSQNSISKRRRVQETALTRQFIVIIITLKLDTNILNFELTHFKIIASVQQKPSDYHKHNTYQTWAGRGAGRVWDRRRSGSGSEITHVNKQKTVGQRLVSLGYAPCRSGFGSVSVVEGNFENLPITFVSCKKSKES